MGRRAASRPGRRRARAGLLAAATLGLAAVVGPAAGRAASASWTISLTPSTIEAVQAATIKATFSNLGGPDGQQDLGCVRIAIPATFTVQSAVVTDDPPDTTWKASIGGLTTVTINTASGGDRLPPNKPTASVTAAIKVSAVVPGTYTWTASAYRSQDCLNSFNDPAHLTVKVQLTLIPTPPPPTATPTPTRTPVPTVRPTPLPLPTILPTLLPLPLPTILPLPTPTVPPTPTVTPPPGSTPTPSPAGSASQAPDRPSPSPSSDAPRQPTGSSGGQSGPPAPGSGASPSSGPPIGAGLTIPGGGPGGDAAAGTNVSLTSGFTTPFGDGFAWAVPGLVLSVPGLLIVLFAILAQALGAAAWLPVVRRRIGGFEVERQRTPERGPNLRR